MSHGETSVDRLRNERTRLSHSMISNGTFSASASMPGMALPEMTLELPPAIALYGGPLTKGALGAFALGESCAPAATNLEDLELTSVVDSTTLAGAPAFVDGVFDAFFPGADPVGHRSHESAIDAAIEDANADVMSSYLRLDALDMACRASFPGSAPRAKRVRAVVSGEVCGVCNKLFFKSGALVRHMRAAHRTKPPPTPPERLDCPQCPKTFSQQGSLNRHLRSIHESRKLHCRYCTLAFGQAFDLKRHQRRKHPHSAPVVPREALPVYAQPKGCGGGRFSSWHQYIM